MKKIIIGTRGSELAICQTKIAINEIQKKYPSCKFDVKIIKTLGDKITNVSLTKINDKGFFVKEIQNMTPPTCTSIALASVLPYELKGGARHCEINFLCILIQALGIAPVVAECVYTFALRCPRSMN